jgi:hypothetical protein
LNRGRFPPPVATSLQELDLFNTQVTDEGVKKLQQALPDGKIKHQPDRTRQGAAADGFLMGGG